MLATSHYSSVYMSSAYNAFLPTIPSPLSPRSANVTTTPRRFFMSSEQENASASLSDNGAEKNAVVTAFSKRTVKKAPSPTQDELKEKRRRNFLRKVQDEREDKRFEQRGEDMMRLDFYQRQRQWEAEQALSAPGLPFDTPEEEGEEEVELLVLLSSQAGSAMQISAPPTQERRPEEEVDEAMAREDEELAALLEFMPEDDGKSEHLWSDDEDYDALFSEFVEKENVMSGQQEAVFVDQGEAMDMS